MLVQSKNVAIESLRLREILALNVANDPGNFQVDLRLARNWHALQVTGCDAERPR